jgi:hypothetical protein
MPATSDPTGGAAADSAAHAVSDVSLLALAAGSPARRSPRRSYGPTPHSALGYRPPAPGVVLPGPSVPLRRPDPAGSAPPAATLH